MMLQPDPSRSAVWPHDSTHLCGHMCPNGSSLQPAAWPAPKAANPAPFPGSCPAPPPLPCMRLRRHLLHHPHPKGVTHICSFLSAAPPCRTPPTYHHPGGLDAADVCSADAAVAGGRDGHARLVRRRTRLPDRAAAARAHLAAARAHSQHSAAGGLRGEGGGLLLRAHGEGSFAQPAAPSALASAMRTELL